MEEKKMLSSAEQFISKLRKLFSNSNDKDKIWSQASIYLQEMLKDPELLNHSKKWPTSPAKLGLNGKHANLLFYEDPDYGFVINALIKKPNAKTTIPCKTPPKP